MRRRALLGALGTTMLAGCTVLRNGDTATPAPASPTGPENWPRTTFGTNNRNANPDATTPRSAPAMEWETPVGTPGEPLVADGQVILSDGDDLLALDADTGDENWRRSVRSEPFTPTVVGESAIVPGDGMVTAHALENGEREWTGIVPEPDDQTPSIAAPPVVVAERVLVAGGGVLACFDGAGERQWWTKPEAPFETVVQPLGGVDRGVYVAATESTCGFHVRPGKTGQLVPQAVRRWSRDTAPPRSGPIAGEQLVFQVVDGGGLDSSSAQAVLIAVNSASGEEEWRRPLGVSRLFHPALVERTLFVPDATNRLHVIDAESGARRQQLRLGDATDPAETRVVGGEDAVIAAPGDGGLVCFGSDGTQRWRMDGPVHDGLALTERGVFATTGTGERGLSDGESSSAVRFYRFS